MFTYTQDLNYSITEKNYTKDIQELFMSKGFYPLILREVPPDVFVLECSIGKVIRNNQVHIGINIEFDKKLLRKIEITLQPDDENDLCNYDIDIKLFYHEEIKSALFDAVNKSKTKYTLRNYRAYYNATPIYGYYEIHGENNFAFHTLKTVPKDEPLTEHIICFDIEVEERSFERARSLAYNLASEFCGFVSVLLDVGFYDLQSKFTSFITTKFVGTTKAFSHERYRTAFFDPELKLYVKDNMNGLCPEKEVEHGNFLNGYVSFYLNNGKEIVHTKIGNASSIEEAFKKHRIYKIKEKMQVAQNEEEYGGAILTEPHFLDQPITIPKELRAYFRGIERFKAEKYENTSVFAMPADCTIKANS